jgi:hypothetical protein
MLTIGPFVLAVLVPAGLFILLRPSMLRSNHLRPNGDRPATGRREPPVWGKGLALSLAVAAPTYLFGLLSGFSVQVAETCAREAGRGPEHRLDTFHQSYLPLSNTCRWDDGATYDLVPGWVNPSLLGCVLFAVLCLSVPVRAAINRRKEYTDH